MTTNSQSFKFIVKRKFQFPPSPLCSQKSTTDTSFESNKTNKDMKVSHKGSSLHHVFFQNFTLLPLPTSKEIFLLKNSHCFPIFFQTPTPLGFLTTSDLQPTSSSPNFPLMIFFHNKSLSLEKCQHHLLKRALLSKKTKRT